MEITFIIRTIFVGFALAAAVGPIWILVMQRTLARGWVVGLASGLGVAIADGLYGLAGGLGLSAITTNLSDFDTFLRIAGGLVLLFLGIKIFFTTPNVEIQAGTHSDRVDAQALLIAFGSLFILTLANPLTIISFAALYTGMGADVLELGSNSAWIFAGSIFTGSSLWWLALVSGVNLLSGKLDAHVFRFVNQIAGAVIVGFGITILF